MADSKTPLLPSLLLLLILVLVPVRGSHHEGVMTRTDLNHLVEVFSGEFDNNVQNMRDVADGATGQDLHFFIRMIHVPVKVPSLTRLAGGYSISRQVYLEEYTFDSPVPSRQRIYNIVLKSGHIEMSTYQAVSASLTADWDNWRTNRSVFESLGVGDLQQDDYACDVQWTRRSACQFSASTTDNSCVFNLGGTMVYLKSEVNVSQEFLVQNDAFLSVADDSVVSGSTTPYLYDRINDVAPLPKDDSMSSECYKLVDLTCLVLTELKGSGKRLFRIITKTFPDCASFDISSPERFNNQFC